MPSTAFNYEIVEKVAVLSQSGDTTKELNSCLLYTSRGV